ncbi:MAG: NUDIX domain-containing protein [Hyphomicrobiaceae bacterium]|nr:NUDIX domain-containing protein [Hyphomicrobiaceae bacterium]
MGVDPKVVVRSRRRVFDGFFKLDEVTFSHRLYDGTASPDKTSLVFERGDAVAVLVFNRDRGLVVLVEQFKVPVLDKSQSGGWITEVAAGIIKPGETPLEAAIRETREETGFQISDPEHVATFFSSPGGSSERIFLFYAVVREADRVSTGGGVRAEGEDIRTIEISPSELFEQLRTKAIEDPKLIIAAYHLKDRLKFDPPKPQPLRPGTIRYRHKSRTGPIIGIKTGPILAVRGVDVWVNSENTDMMMDRIIGRTISASIRYGGAEKDDNGHVVSDVIADELRKKLGRRGFVRIGTVIETVPGALREFGVKRVLHVASVEGTEPGKGVSADLATVETCIGKVLDEAEKRARGFRILARRDRSILLPLIGCGDGGLKVEDVAPAVVSAIGSFLARSPTPSLTEIYVLAFTQVHAQACERAILSLPDFTRLPD